jgi:hypothetical protein
MDERDFAALARNTTIESLTVRFDDGVIDDDIVELSRGCPALKQLHVAGRSALTTVAFEALSHAPFGPTLTSLRLAMSTNIDNDCLALLARCPMLQELELNGMIVRRVFTHAGLTAMFSGCRLLRSIHLRDVGDDELAAIGAGCPLLECLSLGGETDFIVDALGSMFRKLPLLRDVDVGALTDTLVKCIALHVPRLETLHAECRRVTTDGWAHVATRCPLLRHVRGDDGFEEEELAILAQHCPLLETCGGSDKREICVVRSEM